MEHFEQLGEEVIFARLLKNAQMQVESSKSRLRGSPKCLVGNAYMRSLLCCTMLQRLALLDNTPVEFCVYQAHNSGASF
jgi:hypothetical protein